MRYVNAQPRENLFERLILRRTVQEKKKRKEKKIFMLSLRNNDCGLKTIMFLTVISTNVIFDVYVTITLMREQTKIHRNVFIISLRNGK